MDGPNGGWGHQRRKENERKGGKGEMEAVEIEQSRNATGKFRRSAKGGEESEAGAGRHSDWVIG